MKAPILLFGLALVPAMPGYATLPASGVFSAKGGIAEIAFPSHWYSLGKGSTAQFHKSSEAVDRISVFFANRGDMEVLAAWNSYGAARNLSAAIRLTVGFGPSARQQELGELATQPAPDVMRVLLPTALRTADELQTVSEIKAYKVVGVELAFNGVLHCVHSTIEANYVEHIIVVDTWECPVGNRTVRLSTSYEMQEQTQYAGPLSTAWRSLKAKIDETESTTTMTPNPSITTDAAR